VPALLEAYEIPYTFSDPLTLALSLHKGMAKHVVRDAGVPTPDFAVVERAGDVNQIRMPFPVFVKPVAEGSSKGVSGASRVRNASELAARCLALLDQYRQPVLVEEFLPGREFTVGITGTGPEAAALGVMEIHFGKEAERAGYTRSNKTMYEGRVSYTLVEDRKSGEAIDVALAAWRALGCRDAGRVDLRCDSRGAVNFLEVNPLAGLHPTHSDLVILCRLKGIEYQELIERIVLLACDRWSVTIASDLSRLDRRPLRR
jgi:D-alanine-D-alanine ligase